MLQGPVPLGNAVHQEVARRTEQQTQVAVTRAEQTLCSAPQAALVVPFKDDTADRIRECHHMLTTCCPPRSCITNIPFIIGKLLQDCEVKRGPYWETVHGDSTPPLQGMPLFTQVPCTVGISSSPCTLVADRRRRSCDLWFVAYRSYGRLQVPGGMQGGGQTTRHHVSRGATPCRPSRLNSDCRFCCV